MRVDSVPLLLVGNRMQTNEDEFAADAHHDIGMVNRLAVRADAGKYHWLITKIVGKTSDQLRIGPVRERHVGDPVHMIEHQTSCAFEATAFLFEARVIDYLSNLVALAE